MGELSMLHNIGNYYWKAYRRPEFFRTDVTWKDLSEEERNILLYGSRTKNGERLDKKLEGVYNQFRRLVLMKGIEEQTDNTLKKISRFLYECECPDCKGKRLNPTTLSCRINGLNILGAKRSDGSRTIIYFVGTASFNIFRRRTSEG